MSPTKKESAYLHLPTYTAGILYHIGTFLSIALFISFLVNLQFPGVLKWMISAFLLTSFACGVAVLVKRFVSKELKNLSNPDDYISNILVTMFQLMTVVYLNGSTSANASVYASAYFVTASLLLLYMPVGKLKHAIYFFAARYHLASFYGHRNVWPPKIK